MHAALITLEDKVQFLVLSPENHMDLTPAYPPFRMKAKDAAYYCGLSLSAFYRAVEAGELPQGKARLGGKFWLRSDLEAAMVDGKPQHDFSQAI